jgi:peptide/nickel transport system permease protein
MVGYVIRRLAALVPILLGVSLVVFLLVRIMPGSFAQMMLGPNATPEQVEELESQYGLDKPKVEQYFDWLNGVIRGDLGESYIRDRSVASEILDRLPITGELLILTIGITFLLGLTLGAVAAMNHRRPADGILRGVSILGMSVPTFWVATLVILLPSIFFSYAPPFRNVPFFENPWDNLREYVPPALVLGFASACGLARIVRGALLSVLGSDYIRTARAKGLQESLVVRRHALGNAMLPVVTILGLEVATLMGGTVIIEQVFALNGLGRLMLDSVTLRDYPVIQVMALYAAMVFVVVCLLIDLGYAWLDPRVRLTGGRRG